MQAIKAPVALRYYTPASPLRDYISCYYIFTADLPYFSDLMRADLPQLRFMISGHGEYIFHSGQVATAPDVTLLGPTFGSTHLEATGPLVVCGVAFQPAGWAKLVHEDASLFSDRLIDGRLHFGPAISNTFDRMRGAVTSRQMLDILDATMLDLLQNAREASTWFTRVADQWLTGAASPEVDALIAASGMSGRQVERMTRRDYGAPPKLLARKYRALRAASNLAFNRTNWRDVAGDAFADQSHFIREFKQFTGLTPTQLTTNPSHVTQLTFQRRIDGNLPKLTMLS